MLAPLLAGLIVAAYVAALGWLLREESAHAVLGIVALCGVSLSLRLVYTTDFPAGFNEDEPKLLACSYINLQNHNLFTEGCTMMPALLNVLFQGQLVPAFGPNRWAIRSYSTATSVLAVPAAFAAARALGLAVAPSLAAGAFIAVLPWSLFYGRISIGGELTFHELLLLAALARFIWAGGRWAELGIGGLGLALLLYDYFCGRSMVAMPLVAAVLARGWRQRAGCLGVLALALLAWVPHLRTHPENAVSGTVVGLIHPSYFRDPLHIFSARLEETLRTLWTPTALDDWLTIRTAAQHPEVILGLAVVGVLVGARRGLFLLAGFLIGLMPSVLSNSLHPSTHRMQMAFPFIALAAASALDLIKWRLVCAAVTTIAVAVVGFQSVRLYFSDDFWPAFSRGRFNWESTAVVEALPLAPPKHPPLVVMRQIGYFFDPHALVDANFEYLTVDNWFPPSGPSIYAFAADAGPLQSFYETLVGARSVETFGNAFIVRFAAQDWSWLRQHGWTYEARCGDQLRRAQVPTLFQPLVTFEPYPCPGPITHVWRGRWMGPRTQLRVRSFGPVVIETSGGRVNPPLFTAQPDMDITVTTVTQPPDPRPVIGLYESTPVGDRLPHWEWVNPQLIDQMPSVADQPPEPPHL